MTPRLRFWGVRGSFPAALPSCRQLGGNTACVELEWQGAHLIIDAGTGLRALGQQLLRKSPQGPVCLLISHPHWDHIQGFPFFEPAFSDQFAIEVHSLARPESIQSLLADQQRTVFFRFPLEEMRSQLSFREWEEGQVFGLGPFEVEAWRLNHPGICSGFRVRAGSQVLAYISDVAPSEHLLAAGLPLQESTEVLLQRLFANQCRLATDADVLIYDTFFSPEDYRLRSHWGHSTLEDGLQVCHQCSVKNLFTFHHNSEYPDSYQWERIERLPSSSTTKVRPAQEGVSWRLEGGDLTRCPD